MDISVSAPNTSHIKAFHKLNIQLSLSAYYSSFFLYFLSLLIRYSCIDPIIYALWLYSVFTFTGFFCVCMSSFIFEWFCVGFFLAVAVSCNPFTFCNVHIYCLRERRRTNEGLRFGHGTDTKVLVTAESWLCIINKLNDIWLVEACHCGV